MSVHQVHVLSLDLSEMFCSEMTKEKWKNEKKRKTFWMELGFFTLKEMRKLNWDYEDNQDKSDYVKKRKHNKAGLFKSWLTLTLG